MKQPYRTSSTRGFSRAVTLMQSRIRAGSEGRGFAETRLLTHWAAFVGEDVAAVATPVNVGYGRGGMGATLTILTTGANAPMLEMQKPQILDRVNGCYGYRAIARIRITQTAPTGFAEGRVAFAAAPKAPPLPDPATQDRARAVASGVANDDLRAALEALAAKVLSKPKTRT
ncbi:hypothetical protein SAMN04488003_12222 [Loktanella fryxellensis]|uniref:DUF721 domain-containing protein n=1 Tax=Loktanella fryxellensis TaxID=245187 RepID=A0A1H8HT61_9RHOB|nr:DUF721 domain-containing protein [Loktanella fryxellensis]SEN59201.1 hypothetical protein SAMN04488003_12222 [Loktanella fryxellensis]